MAQIYKMTQRKASPMPYHTSRPFHVACYYAEKDREIGANVARSVSCGSEAGAFRSAVMKLFTGRYMKSVVHGLDGEQLYKLTRHGNKIEIEGVFFLWDDWLKILEREKKAKERFKRQVAGPRS